MLNRHKYFLHIVFLIVFFSAGVGFEIAAQPERHEVGSEASTFISRIEVLVDSAMESAYNHPEKSRLFLEEADRIVLSSRDRLARAHIAQAYSVYYWARGDYRRALEQDRLAVKLFQSLNMPHELCYALNGLGVTLTETGLNHEALKNLLEAERIAITYQDSVAMQMIQLNLGSVFDQLGNYEEAARYYNSALDLALILGLYAEAGDTFNNLGEIYLKRGNHDLAYDYYSKAYKAYKSENDLTGISLVKGNLADYYRVTQNFSIAEKMYFEALEEYRKAENENGRCYIYLGLGKLYLATNQYNLSEKNLNLALDLANERAYTELQTEALRELAKLNYEKGDYDEAYRFFTQYDQTKEQFYKESSSAEFDNLRLAYEAEEKERQIAALQSEREKEHLIAEQKDRLQKALITLAVLLVFFLIFGVLMYLRLKGFNRRLETQQAVLESKNEQIESQAALLQETNERLLNEKKLAEISSEAKAEFVSVLSHEIRTPLNAIVGISHALREEIKEPGHQKYLKALSNSANLLLQFTTNILELSKIDAGKLEIQKVPVNLHYLVPTITDSFDPAAREKHLFIDITVDPEIPPNLEGDQTRISQVLLNLLSNAIKYTDSGGVSLNVRLDSILDDTVNVEIMVMDTGNGIPDELQPRVFSRYSRLQKESTLTPQGSGLGLSITKSLVELMGGNISFKSKAGEGTTFKVNLPLRLDRSQISHIKHADATAEENILKGRTMLLVEDNEVNIMFTERLLKKLGIETVVARNGKEATDLALSRHFDLILMDLQMPILNGMEATKIILEKKPHARIVALTANSDERIAENIKSAGFTGLLVKPFKPELFGKKLSDWLEKELIS